MIILMTVLKTLILKELEEESMIQKKIARQAIEMKLQAFMGDILVSSGTLNFMYFLLALIV